MATKKKFPDLTGPKGKKDGKVTKADILAARGVIPKASESFIDEVMARVEENILLEEEHIQNVLAEAEENGIDVDYLTEEELSELFGFGMDRSTGRSRAARGRMTAPEGSRRRNRAEGRVARIKRQKSQRAAMMDRLAKVSAERKAAKAGAAKPADEKPATQTTDKKDPATGTYLTKGKAKGRRPAPPKPGQMGKPGTRDPATGMLRTSTDIVRGARLALAERVFDSLLNRED